MIIKGINLEDTIKKEQLDLQKTLKQEKADSCYAMHNSKYHPNDDVRIHWIAVDCSIMPTHNPSMMQFKVEEAQRLKSSFSH